MLDSERNIDIEQLLADYDLRSRDRLEASFQRIIAFCDEKKMSDKDAQSFSDMLFDELEQIVQNNYTNDFIRGIYLRWTEKNYANKH